MMSGPQLGEGIDAPASLLSDYECLIQSFEKLSMSINTVCKYVEDVKNNVIIGDIEIGRDIARALAAIPPLNKAELHKMCETSMQDVIMVLYLSNLAKQQLSVADRISTMLLQN